MYNENLVCHRNGNNSYYFKYYSLFDIYVSYYECNLCLALFVPLICLVIEKKILSALLLFISSDADYKRRRGKKRDDASYHFFIILHSFLFHLNDDSVHFSVPDYSCIFNHKKKTPNNNDP